MRPLPRFADVAFWLALLAWVSAIVTAGTSAAMAFPTMREFEVVVPKFSAYDETQHWAIAAGVLLERMFTLTDMIQLVAAVMAIVAILVGYLVGARRFKRPSEVLRAVCIGAAALLLAYRVFMLAPEMNRSLHQYWHAAEQGEAEVAAQHRLEFQAKHPIASRIYGIMLLLLLTGAAATAWSPSMPAAPARTHEFQEPELARRGRR